MTRVLTASSILALSTSVATAGGLDRTMLPIDIIFQEGNYAEISLGATSPSLGGTGVGITGALPAGTDYSGTGSGFSNLGLGVKYDITDALSVAVLFEQPFGADIRYDGNGFSSELGGTKAVAGSDMISALLRYSFTDRISAYGGVRVVKSSGDIDLRGFAYGAPIAPALAPFVPLGGNGVPLNQGGTGFTVNGYSVQLSPDTAVGYVVGAAYEIPDIALRVALTYNSAVTHKFDTKEFFNGIEIGSSTTEVELPQSVALDFQSGVAEDTLVFGRIRWAEWSAFQIDPEEFKKATGGGLVNLDDVTTYTLGVGRQFTDTFGARFSVDYEESGDDLVSPLAPTNGSIAYSLGGRWAIGEGASFSAGLRYTDFGDAKPETGTPDVARADFTGNSALSVGFRLGVSF